MAEEVATVESGDACLRPTAATRTSQHEDSGGGGGGGGGGGVAGVTASLAVPIPSKRGLAPHSNNTMSNSTTIGDSELQLRNRANRAASSKCTPLPSDSEDGFLSTSPDSANGDGSAAAKATAATPLAPPPICLCTSPANCVSLKNILDSFKAPLSEEQAWALIFQSVRLYRGAAVGGRVFADLEMPDSLVHLSVHRDGSVHCSWSEAELREREQERKRERERRRQDRHGDEGQAAEEPEDLEDSGDDHHALVLASHKKILRKLGVVIYTALDYNLQADEQCQMSQELEELITFMTAEESDDDCIDEGIDEGYKRWDDDADDTDDKCNETKDLDFVLEACKNHVKPTVPEDHYKAVCRALVTETIELRIFLQQVLNDDTDNLRLKADSQTSKQELAKLGFNDWARFWVQVIEELRRGVRLKKNNFSRTPIEYELTPYEILMEDIRSKKYQLRKVMVNGDIPPRVKKDAHALILEFIRSRPPLKKASERQLPPPIQRTPSPREQLMDSIRRGRTLKHIQPPPQPRLKDRLLPPPTTTITAASGGTSSSAASSSTSSSSASTSQPSLDPLKQLQATYVAHTTPRSKQRLIKVDFSLLQDDDPFFDDPLDSGPPHPQHGMASSAAAAHIGVCSQPKMPPYPIGGYMVAEPAAPGAPSGPLPAALTTRVLRRTTYDLATQCESRRASLRRHTIVGCQSNFDETHSMPPSRPESRQSDVNATAEAAPAAPTKPQPNNCNNYYSLPTEHQQQQQSQAQLKRSQSPSGSGSSASGDVGVGGGSGSSNCSRSSSSVGPWKKSFLDEKTWHERGDDRLSLTLEEIVHIRSVMTKAELEGLPVGVRVKEDVEKRKVCFLCLRTRFSIFGPWGIQCKLCQRTVCSKCYTKMRLPVEHFRNVPLVLISPSLLASPAGSSTPSPSHHAHQPHSSSTGNILDDTFPKSLIERLLRSESERKTRNTVGSAPSSPKHQRSNMSTPGLVASSAAGHAVEAIHEASTSGSANGGYSTNNNNYNKENALHNGVRPTTTTSSTAAGAGANNKHISLMSRSMEGPRSLPANSPARPHSNSSTLDRKSKFSRAFTLSSSGSQLGQDQKENVRGEIVPVCHDCKGLVMEITRSSKQTRSSARNRALQNLTLDLSPVYK